jgi:DNA-binding winged helix-turn-helix (wHTH) protein
MAQGNDPAAGPVWLDLEHEQLRRGDKALHLRPKSFALLRYLVAHPGRVLSKDELVEAVWPRTAISDGVLTVSINEVRHALGDAAQAPQYLETVPRRGYRWRGALPTTAPFPDLEGSRPAASLAPPLPIGREAEVAQLKNWLAQARRGGRQVGFVTGEAGIGKTTVVDALCGADRPGAGPVAGAGAVYRVLWRRRSLSPGPGGPGAALPRAGWRAPGRIAGAARPDLAGADAGPPRG